MNFRNGFQVVPMLALVFLSSAVTAGPAYLIGRQHGGEMQRVICDMDLERVRETYLDEMLKRRQIGERERESQMEHGLFQGPIQE